ncbi:MAG: ABC-2 family transporter protein [Methanocella sp. PtaU1.Bin125]|nr:MAG: ABC-2 family transporter protein [Methanocella sp. PtaU1.Bin125]
MALEVFIQAIKDKYKGATILAVILFLYVFWIASFFPSIKPMMGMYDEMLSNPTFKALIGEVASMSTFGGFMSIEVFSYMGIVLGAYIAFLTASFVAGEIEQKSSELMLSLPVSRVHIILSRFAILVPIIVAIVTVMLLAVVLGAAYVGESVDTARFAYGMVFTGGFLLAVAGGSMLLSALMSDGKKAAFGSIGVLLAMFLVENIGQMVTSIDWARRLSLFHYAKVSDFIANPDAVISWGNLGILLAVAIVFLALAVFVYHRRDINVT